MSDEAPRGVRLPADEPLFRVPSTDPAIEPDRVNPAVEGYFRIPAVWIGEAPSGSANTSNADVRPMLQQKLSSGITAVARQDGTFLFDFSEWELGPVIEIPGYRKPSPPYRATDAHSKAEARAEKIATLRAQVLNVHQACLTTAESDIKRRAAAMGFPISAGFTLKSLSLSASFPYSEDFECPRALVRNVLNGSYNVARTFPLSRRTIEIEVVARSFELLDQIISLNDPNIIRQVELAYMAACRVIDKQVGEAAVLSWSVCEQIVSRLWLKYISERPKEELPKDRRDKLQGRDFTASIIVESLQLAGVISTDLYRHLEVARKSRNAWAHSLREPNARDVWMTLEAVQRAIDELYKIRLRLQVAGRGGVPQWPVWFWDAQKLRREQGRQ